MNVYYFLQHIIIETVCLIIIINVIVSITCIEDALDECRCGLLLVSHDTHFLSKLTHKNWHFEVNQHGIIKIQII
ncbi:MAG: hypothetical protein JXB48_22410 [Candidatus Latescibacteria bacterium]|nr:hypothetical protein [Candidatus Latescibacterota bacterium]